MRIFKIKIRDRNEVTLLILIFFVLFIKIINYLQFKQLPSPIYGGDIYFHKGIAEHISQGLFPWKDPVFKGEYMFYPWLTHVLIVVLSKLTFLSITTVTIKVFPVITLIFGAFTTYLLASKIFKSKIFSYLAVLFFASSTNPLTHPNNFANFAMLPLVLYFMIYERNIKQNILAGVFLGLAALQYPVSFIFSAFFLFLIFFYRTKFKVKKIKRDSKNLLIILCIALPITLIYYYPVIFIYKLSTPNPFYEYVYLGKKPSVSWIFQVVSRFFFNFANIFSFIFSCLAILGTFYAIFGNKERFRYPLLFFLASILLTLHPFITLPIFKKSFLFYYFTRPLFWARIFFVILGVKFIYDYLRLRKQPADYFLILFTVFLLFFSFYNVTKWKEEKWVRLGLTEPDTYLLKLYEAGEWIKKNTEKDAVFLALHPESGFACFALSGRYQLIIRRTHANPFVDVEKRNADAAIILFGNDTRKIEELIDNYGVKYIYIDLWSLQSLRTVVNYWDLIKEDPVKYGEYAYYTITASTNYANYLKKYGVNFTKVYIRLDPAYEHAPKYWMLAIKPGDLNDYIKENFKPVFNNGAVTIMKKVK